MAVKLQFGDAFIAHSRNKLAEHFLRTPFEWALTVDDDMILPWGNAEWFNTFTKFDLPETYAARNTIDRLLSHGKTLVGALYYHRNGTGRGVYAESKEDEGWLKRGPHDVLKPTRWVGTGCMLIHRTVFEDIEKKFPQLARNSEGKNGNWFSSSEHELRSKVAEASEVLSDPNLSETAKIARVQQLITEANARSAQNSGLGMGEDVAFCVRAAQSGHQPYVDIGLICGHIGFKVYGPKFLK
jgi:hypothetical protein